MIGEVFGERYRVSRRIAAGGMGVVCEAVHVVTKQKVALKIINGLTASERESEIWLRRFEREARAAGSIDTPHIVRVIDAGTDDDKGVPYIAMELLEGKDLAQILRESGSLAPAAALEIARQVCSGLAAAHAAGVVHRDLKPGNIFVARGRGEALTVKIVDFGVAKLASELEPSASSELTRTGALLGTPAYMSPEQVQGDKDIDLRSDLWALGVVLYKMLTGALPRDGSQGIARLAIAISTEPAPAVQEQAPWVGAGVAAIVRRALAIERAERYQSAEQMLVDIRRELGDEPELTREMLVAPSPDLRRSIAPRDVTQSVARPEGRSRMRPLGATIAVALLGVVAFAWARAPVQVEAAPSALPEVPAASATASTAPEREVIVAIEPPSASVDVGGVRRSPVGGNLTLRGPLGSVHVVQLEHEGRTVSAEVAITQDGPRPARVVLAPVSQVESAATAAQPPPRRAARTTDRTQPAPEGLAPTQAFE